MHSRYFVECPSICLVIRLQFQILGKNTTEVMCPAHGLMLGTTYYQYVLLLIVYCVSCSTISDSQTLAHQSSLSMGFSRQEYWSGLPCPPPGNLPNPGVESRSPALQADSLLSEPLGKPPITGKVNLSYLIKGVSAMFLHSKVMAFPFL